MISEEQLTLILERLNSLEETVKEFSAQMDSIEGKYKSISDRLDDMESEISDLSDRVDDEDESYSYQPTEEELEAQRKAHEEAVKIREEQLQKQINTPLKITADKSGSIGGCDSKVNKEIILPDDLLVIRANTFAFCMNLEQLSIPASVKSIGKKLCFRCLHLKSVKFLGPCPEGLENAFEECWRLKEISVPASDLAAYQKAIPKHLSSIKAY